MMALAANALVFLASFGAMWFFAGMLIDAVHRIAQRFSMRGFTVSFFFLGFLTSIGELSVAFNAGVAGVPELSAGNLIGSAVVVLLFIVPALAIVGNGIRVECSVSSRNLLMILAVIALPAILAMNGGVTRLESLLLLVAYAAIVLALYRDRRSDIPANSDDLPAEVLSKARATASDIARILGAGAFVFGAAYFLVGQAEFFADYFGVPASLIGLLVISLGTNAPELVIAVRAASRGLVGIAFGDYLGATTLHAATFGLLALFSGGLALDAGEFVISGVVLLSGLGCFYLFANTRRTLSRLEGILLLLFYVAFVGFQVLHAMQ